VLTPAGNIESYKDYQFRTRGNSPPDSFDLLIEAGEDIRKLPLHLRKASLARLFARRVDGILTPSSS
jgi:ATP-dependent DNA ligase